MASKWTFSRRSLLGGLGLLGLTGCAATAQQLITAGDTAAPATAKDVLGQHSGHAANMGNMFEGDVDPAVNGFDPTAMLTDFDYGKVSTLPSGQTLREYTLYAVDKLIEIAPGVTFPAWTYNGRVPGPAIRCTQGDRVRVTFSNGSAHPHSIHFHGIHAAAADGVTQVQPGEQTVYEFDAEPFGLHLYHCHVPPFMRHIHKGLYGTFIVDPPTPRPAAKELVMVMNAFDTNFDGENEIYAVNTVGFHYTKHPIPLKLGERVRIYLSNFTEFDPINSFHLHANLFDVYRTGTRLEPNEYTDVITMGQAERHILEFTYTRPGQYMFHAHQSEFNGLGWMGIFDVTESGAASAPFESAARLGICRLS
jgi:FtsP/CotA-like multicopper oxidase with cupredoxin domain